MSLGTSTFIVHVFVPLNRNLTLHNWLEFDVAPQYGEYVQLTKELACQIAHVEHRMTPDAGDALERKRRQMCVWVKLLPHVPDDWVDQLCADEDWDEV